MDYEVRAREETQSRDCSLVPVLIMDIFNRSHAISEDTLHFDIFPPLDVKDKSSATAFAACVQAYAESLLPGFIWHRDPFEVKLAKEDELGDAYRLEGWMRVGDCVDDEWCTVWLLKQISEKWDAVIR